MPVVDDARMNVTTLYQTMWGEWYDSAQTVTPATLIVDEGDHAPGYNNKTDELYIFLAGFDLDDAAGDTNILDRIRTDFANAPAWARDLVHEMMHEFQFKGVGDSVTNAGKLLYQEYSKRFSGPGHDERFFTAIALHASYFNMTPETFVQNL